MVRIQNRIDWVDVGKYICIMFVMLSHLESQTYIMRMFYSPFALTVFFFLAGYVYKQPDSFKVHITKKIKGLLVPWFIFSNFNILLSAVISLKGDRNTISEMSLNLLQIRGYGDGLWFIAALFAAFIPFYFVIKLDNKFMYLLISIVLVVISELYGAFFPSEFWPWGSNSLPWHLEYIFKAMLWMVLGYCYKLDLERVLDDYNTIINRIIVLVVYLTIIYWFSPYLSGIWNRIMIYISSLVGIMLIIMFSKSIKTNAYISYVGANTLIYFALHGKLLAVIEKLLHMIADPFYSYCLDNVWYSSMLSIVMALLLSVILIIPSLVINNWFPWMVGRKRKAL
jgi:fucose 4-O-acetylase-like acetyltransferase